MTFGRRLTPQLAAPSGAAAAIDIPTPMMRWAAIAALSAVAVLATLHVWFNVFNIPLEYSSPSLFAPPRGGPSPLWMGPGEKPKAGWMAWYVPVLTTAFFASVVLARLTRQRHRWSVLSMAVAGCVAALVGATTACWAEHNGLHVVLPARNDAAAPARSSRTDYDVARRGIGRSERSGRFL